MRNGPSSPNLGSDIESTRTKLRRGRCSPDVGGAPIMVCEGYSEIVGAVAPVAAGGGVYGLVKYDKN